jgi:hypothetical protein
MQGRAGLTLLTAAVVGLPLVVHAQTTRATVACTNERLGAAEREICASPDLTRLAGEVDRLTAQLEATLTGREREALVDTERPVVVERNDLARGLYLHLASRRPAMRVDLSGLAHELNQEEATEGRRVFDGVDEITPKLLLDGSPATSIPADHLVARVEHHLRTGQPAWNPHESTKQGS